MRGHVAVKAASCVACRRCALACAIEHSASKDLFAAVGETPSPVSCVEIREHRGLNVPIECRHCENPQCISVCPTGAIQRTTLPRKLGLDPYAEKGPISVGTAFFDRGRCLPWAMETPCVVCE